MERAEFDRWREVRDAGFAQFAARRFVIGAVIFFAPIRFARTWNGTAFALALEVAAACLMSFGATAFEWWARDREYVRQFRIGPPP